jgi:hypothetical protein
VCFRQSRQLRPKRQFPRFVSRLKDNLAIPVERAALRRLIRLVRRRIIGSPLPTPMIRPPPPLTGKRTRLSANGTTRPSASRIDTRTAQASWPSLYAHTSISCPSLHCQFQWRNKWTIGMSVVHPRRFVVVIVVFRKTASVHRVILRANVRARTSFRRHGAPRLLRRRRPANSARRCRVSWSRTRRNIRE